MYRTRRGSSLIGILISMLIIVLATVFFVMGGMGPMGIEPMKPRADGLGETMIGQARYTTEDTVCQVQLQQIRGLVQLAMDHVDEVYPDSLGQVSGMPTGYDKCPIGKEPYSYDASSGRVKCPHPGHENY